MPSSCADVRSLFATTKRLNKVSKECVLCGSDNIGVKGRTIIESGAVLRGDLSTIELGSYCLIGARVVLRPPEQVFQGRIAFIPLSIGDHVLIEQDTIVEAAAIGECSHIGQKCIIVRQTTQPHTWPDTTCEPLVALPLTSVRPCVSDAAAALTVLPVQGPRCILSPCTRVLDGSVLPAGSVTAPFSVWAGVPAVQVGRLPDSWQQLWQEHTTQFYKNFLPLAPAAATAAGAAGATSAPSASPPAVS
jgi:dynactin-5